MTSIPIWLRLNTVIPLRSLTLHRGFLELVYTERKNIQKKGNFLPHFAERGFCKFKLSGSIWNRSRMILLDQEMNFKKNPIEKKKSPKNFRIEIFTFRIFFERRKLICVFFSRRLNMFCTVTSFSHVSCSMLSPPFLLIQNFIECIFFSLSRNPS